MDLAILEKLTTAVLVTAVLIVAVGLPKWCRIISD